MIPDLGQFPGWPRRRWWGFVALIFILQLTLIFWLGQREVPPPRPAKLSPNLRLMEGNAPELLALIDPTLFALPHRQGFSGLAWLKNPTQDLSAFAWSEPPDWLQISTPPLTAPLELFIATNLASPLLTLSQSEPPLRLPVLPPLKQFPESSKLRITGDLARRRLLTAVELPPWPASEILTNSQVQLVVDAAGKPVSATLLYPGSGFRDADTNAYWQATKARFAPLNLPENDTNLYSGLTWGQMIFEWYTLPVPRTNTSPAPK